MPKSCGQIVNILGSGLRKIGVWVSTDVLKMATMGWMQRVQHALVHITVPVLSPGLSPLKIATLPLTEHYFYPVSTVPTNNRNQIKFKKGNK